MLRSFRIGSIEKCRKALIQTRSFNNSALRFQSPCKSLTDTLTNDLIKWSSTNDVFHPYETKIDTETIKLRINDFPDEPLYTVMKGEQELFHTNGFTKNWLRPDDNNSINDKKTGNKINNRQNQGDRLMIKTQIRNYGAAPITSNLKPEVVKNVRVLKNLGATPEEVQTYLNMYYSVDPRRFGVIKVGGGVIQDNIDDLVESISALVKFGLIPVVVHGAGPQMNSILKQMGIPSAYDEGLRITTPEILKVARKIFAETNFELVNALEKKGTRATAIQTGVFEAKPLNMARWGYVGEVTNVNVDPIFMAIDNGCVPVLTCMGQSEDGHFLNINADIAARDVAKVIQPRTVVFVSQKGGLIDEDGKIIQSIDINYDYENLLKKSCFQPGDRLKLKEIKDLMQVLPGGSTVSITSAALMARELLTHSLSGTLVSNTERINCYSDFSQISEERVIQLIEKAFNGKVREGYLASIKGDIDRIYLSELYHALAIVTKLNGVPYLHKFAVSEEFQMHGLGGRLFEMLQNDYKTLAWRSRVTNPINRWYFKRSEGSFTSKGWTVFWYGISSFNKIEETIKVALEQPKDITRNAEIQQPVAAEVQEKTKTEKHPVFKIGLIGARGHTGLELIKLIENHPSLHLSHISSRSFVGKPLSHIYPETKTKDLIFEDIEPSKIADHRVDLWVLAMPNGSAKGYVDNLPETTKVVDLSADYRFDPTWQYGLPELADFRQKIRLATRVANPGCYATGQQLAILPLVDTIHQPTDIPILVGTPYVFGVSGYSGAGTTPSRKNDITVLKDNLLAYSLQGHIHENEVSYQLSKLGHLNGVRFVPHVASWFRGIHLTVSVNLSGTEDREEILFRYRNFYKNEPLVKVIEEIPEVRDIANQHYVEIGGFNISKDKTKLVVIATIDNLLKGAATQCMQNVNLMLGLDEYAGIPRSTTPS